MRNVLNRMKKQFSDFYLSPYYDKFIENCGTKMNITCKIKIWNWIFFLFSTLRIFHVNVNTFEKKNLEWIFCLFKYLNIFEEKKCPFYFYLMGASSPMKKHSGPGYFFRSYITLYLAIFRNFLVLVPGSRNLSSDVYGGLKTN